MATIQQTVIAISTVLADMAAQASEATVPIAGLPDTADVVAIPMPGSGAVVGISVAGKPASGDTVKITPFIATDDQGSGRANIANLATTISNGTKSASTITSKDDTTAQFTAGQCLGLRAQTTTGGTYTALDVVVILYVQLGMEDL